jgi:small-conductance mechanosensitive channel
VVLAEIAVPTGLCLAFQALGVGALVLYARLDPLALLLVVLAYPAIALAVNGIWNLHYLTSAARRAGGRPQSASAVGTLLVVAVSFLIFYPAGWTAERIFDRHPSIVLAAAGFLGIQYAMDILLLGILATLFRRSESTHDNP